MYKAILLSNLIGAASFAMLAILVISGCSGRLDLVYGETGYTGSASFGRYTVDDRPMPRPDDLEVIE